MMHACQKRHSRDAKETQSRRKRDLVRESVLLLVLNSVTSTAKETQSRRKSDLVRESVLFLVLNSVTSTAKETQSRRKRDLVWYIHTRKIARHRPQHAVSLSLREHILWAKVSQREHILTDIDRSTRLVSQNTGLGADDRSIFIFFIYLFFTDRSTRFAARNSGLSADDRRVFPFRKTKLLAQIIEKKFLETFPKDCALVHEVSAPVHQVSAPVHQVSALVHFRIFPFRLVF